MGEGDGKLCAIAPIRICMISEQEPNPKMRKRRAKLFSKYAFWAHKTLFSNTWHVTTIETMCNSKNHTSIWGWRISANDVPSFFKIQILGSQNKILHIYDMFQRTIWHPCCKRQCAAVTNIQRGELSSLLTKNPVPQNVDRTEGLLFRTSNDMSSFFEIHILGSQNNILHIHDMFQRQPTSRQQETMCSGDNHAILWAFKAFNLEFCAIKRRSDWRIAFLDK